MPELPEVETIRRQLEPRLVGARIREVTFEDGKPSAVDGITEAEFARSLAGRTFEGVGRRGKYLDFQLSDGLRWVQHLRMTGKLLLRPGKAPFDAYTRFIVHLDDGRELRFADVRKFGRAGLAVNPGDLMPALGPEPWDQQFTAGYLRERLERGKGPIKARVLDQSLVAGVGNIYADEALFHAGIHPLRTGSNLRPAEWPRLRDAIQWALAHGVGLRGASLRDFFDIDGEQGALQDDTFVVGRATMPCRLCGTPIEKIRVAGRGTSFCPSCQPRSSAVSAKTYEARSDAIAAMTAGDARE